MTKPPLGNDFSPQFTFDSVGTLNIKDLKEIKNIITTSGHVPGELKELVKNITI